MRNLNTIPHAKDRWSEITPEAPDWTFRIWPVRGIETLWRKNTHPALYGGYQITRVTLDTRLAREWLRIAGYDAL